MSMRSKNSRYFSHMYGYHAKYLDDTFKWMTYANIISSVLINPIKKSYNISFITESALVYYFSINIIDINARIHKIRTDN